MGEWKYFPSNIVKKIVISSARCGYTSGALNHCSAAFEVNYEKLNCGVKLNKRLPLCLAGNLAFFVEAMKSLPFQIVANGFIAVETFFFIR